MEMNKMSVSKLTRKAKVCKALKAAQNAQGLTQADIAKRLKVSQTTVSRWYNNTDEMPLGSFRLLCTVLSLSPQDVLSIE